MPEMAGPPSQFISLEYVKNLTLQKAGNKISNINSSSPWSFLYAHYTLYIPSLYSID
jgi:hypothetical protein